MKPIFYKKLYLSIVTLCLSIPALERASMAPRAYSSAQRAAQRTLPQVQQGLYRGMATTPRVQPRMPARVSARSLTTMPRVLMTTPLPAEIEESRQKQRGEILGGMYQIETEYLRKKNILSRLYLQEVDDVLYAFRTEDQKNIDVEKDIAIGIVSDAVKMQTLATGLAKEAKNNPYNEAIGELAKIADDEAHVALIKSGVLTSGLNKLANKGNKKAKEMSIILEKAIEEEKKEELEKPIATTWEERFKEWVASLSGVESISSKEVEARNRFNKLISKNVSEAVKDSDWAQLIVLDAKKQTDFARILLIESSKKPDNENLAKLAEIARKNAFAAELRLQQLNNLLEKEVAEGNQRALIVLSVLKGEEPKIFFGPEERWKPLFRSKEDEELYKKLKSQYFSEEGKAAIKKSAAAAIGAIATAIGAYTAGAYTKETEQAAKAKQPAQAQESWYDRIKNYFWGKPQVQQPQPQQPQQPQAKPNK